MKIDKIYVTDFAPILEHLLIVQEITQKELADKVGVSQSNVSAWLNGKQLPRLDKIVKICNVLDVQPNQLLGYGIIHLDE